MKHHIGTVYSTIHLYIMSFIPHFHDHIYHLLLQSHRQLCIKNKDPESGNQVHPTSPPKKQKTIPIQSTQTKVFRTGSNECPFIECISIQFILSDAKPLGLSVWCSILTYHELSTSLEHLVYNPGIYFRYPTWLQAMA